jgi:hypothetical protein
MAVLASDNFDRADGGLGANWTTITGMTAPAIVSNAVVGDADPEGAYYNAVTPPADQWAQVTVTTPLTNHAGSGDGVGPAIRIQTGAQSQYNMQAQTPDCQVYVANAGSYQQIGSTGTGFVAGDVAYLEIQGTTVVSKKNGSTSGMPTGTDATYASGRFGFFIANDLGVVDPKLNDWSGGDFSSGAQNPPRPSYREFPKYPLRTAA